jgi:hypothetical protein
LIINNNYNDSVYFNNEEDKENILEEFHNQLPKIISNVITDRKNECKINYKITNERKPSGSFLNKNNISFIRRTANQISLQDKNLNDTFMEKINNQTSKAIKLNLNISNNYFNLYEGDGIIPITLNNERRESKRRIFTVILVFFKFINIIFYFFYL